MEHIIDATENTIGRTATKAATILMGKDEPSFTKNQVANVRVKIINASKAKIANKKLTTVFFERYSGYPGGLKKDSMEKVIEKKGYKQLFENAVYGMIPANKLRAKIMKNLIVTE